jgi:signal transduction histidine kinase
MNNSLAWYKKPEIRTLTFVGILLSLLVASDFYFNLRQRYVSAKFKDELRLREELILNSISDITGYIDTSAFRNTISWADFNGHLSIDNDLHLLIYENKNLVFWNDIAFQPPSAVSGKAIKGIQGGQLSNGWYIWSEANTGTYRVILGYLIKSQFSINNEFLTNNFAGKFGIADGCSLHKLPGIQNIYSLDGRFLFSLDPSTSDFDNGLLPVIQLILVILCYLYIVNLTVLIYKRIGLLSAQPNIALLMIIIDLFLLRTLQHYFQFPGVLYNSSLFSPAIYSSSALLSSLGDLLLYAILLFVSAVLFHRYFSIQNASAKRLTSKIIFVLLPLNVFIALFFVFTGFITQRLIMDSTFSLKLQDISAFSAKSGVALLILAILYAASWLFASRALTQSFRAVCQQSGHSFGSRRDLWIILPVAGLISILTFLIFHIFSDYVPGVALITYLIFIIIINRYYSGNEIPITLPRILLVIAIYSLFGTLTMNDANRTKDHQITDALAKKLAEGRNPVTEMKFESLQQQILGDSAWWNVIYEQFSDGIVKPEDLNDRFKMHFLDSFWTRYDIQVTLCDSGNILTIQPGAFQVSCRDYFSQLIGQFGKNSVTGGLFYMDYGDGKENYLAWLSPDITEINHSGFGIYLELSLNTVLGDPGFPALLTDGQSNKVNLLPEQSFAIYQDKKLTYSAGSFQYPYKIDRCEENVFRKDIAGNNTMHEVYPFGPVKCLVISSEKPSLFTRITPFSYLFFMFALSVVIFNITDTLLRGKSPLPKTMRNRLYLIFIGILVLTLFATGIVQVLNLLKINEKKDISNLKERSSSIRIELQHKFGKTDAFKAIPAEQMSNFLVKLSNVFFAEINCFDSTGTLIATNRPNLFSSGIIASRIHPEAMLQLKSGGKTLFINKESIGKMTFYSAYLPFYNDQDKLLGYINLPYYSRQDESKREIASFVVTFLNVYILLLILGIIITIVISDYFTASLVTLTGRLSKFRLDKRNEKITWRSDDEIGQLVGEYNRMVEELDKSARLLAMSERESAWREMARQVAHEIKNPLTPLKLSAQHLQKAWNDKTPDIDIRINRFLSTLVTQIDTLSEIAGNFSDFAKMPATNHEIVEVKEVVDFVVSMYPLSEKSSIEVMASENRYPVKADRKQLVRVFTNLVNNALQSYGQAPPGPVKIIFQTENNRVRISVTDEGSGIPEMMTEQIFRPGFSTKATGMGLGLSIVKAILTDINAEIKYTPNTSGGSVFIVVIPIINEPESSVDNICVTNKIS